MTSDEKINAVVGEMRYSKRLDIIRQALAVENLARQELVNENKQLEAERDELLAKLNWVEAQRDLYRAAYERRQALNNKEKP